MRPIPQTAVDFVAAHEGFRAKAYRDVADVWTIGYGHAGATEGQTITKAEARDLLLSDLQTARTRLYARIGAVVEDLTDNQYAALLSFVFNLGAGATWTIWKRLKARQFDQVPLEMMKFVNAGGKKVQGLVNRRADEVKLWSLGEPGSTVAHVPSTVTRATPTPPTPADPVSPSRSAAIITSAAAAVTAAPPMVNQVIAAVQPYAAHSEVVQRMLGGLAVIGAVLAIAGLALMWSHKRRARS